MTGRQKRRLSEAKSLGLALLLLRRARGLTPAQVAKGAAITRAKLSTYETGRNLPRQDSVRPLVEAMGLPLETLLRVQEYVAELMSGDPAVPPGKPGRLPRQAAVRLAQETGKAVAHCCLAFLELQAGGWEDEHRGE